MNNLTDTDERQAIYQLDNPGRWAYGILQEVSYRLKEGRGIYTIYVILCSMFRESFAETSLYTMLNMAISLVEIGEEVFDVNVHSYMHTYGWPSFVSTG